MSTLDAAPKISIILPLFDRRNAGWESLSSALRQRFPRERYEVVAVTARSQTSAAGDPEIDAALARCDAVVRTDLDDTVAANEIQLYLAGYRRSTGQLVLFCEGHTVLRDDCCALIDEYFDRHRDCDIAWAPRLNYAVSPLGELVAMHNDRHQRRALAAGVFSLGANSVIRRTTFEALGGLEARYLRFSETVLFHRALERRAVIGCIHAPLALHYNDMPVALWRQLVQDTGAGRFAYYDDLLAQGHGHDARIRHPIYVHARQPWIADLLAPVLRAAGRALIRAAAGALRINRHLAYHCYVLALGCTDLAGYSRARAQCVLQRRAAEAATPDPRAAGERASGFRRW
jgi:hypothetical protein